VASNFGSKVDSTPKQTKSFKFFAKIHTPRFLGCYRLSASNPLTPWIDKNLGNPHGEKGVGPYACGS
jgi:hypothetical protein